MMSGWCRVFSMLARVMILALMLVAVDVGVGAERLPNVVLIFTTAKDAGEVGFMPSVFGKEKEVMGGGCDDIGVSNNVFVWRGLRQEVRVSPGKSAVTAAVTLGKSPLECGVVSDLDWRRKHIVGSSLLDHASRLGYRCKVIGKGGEFARLTDGWGGSGKEFNATDVAKSILAEGMPFFCLLREGRDLKADTVFRMLRENLLPVLEETEQETLIVMLRSPEYREAQLQKQAHYGAELYYAHFSGGGRFRKGAKVLGSCRTDWELHAGLFAIIAGRGVDEPGFRIFHEANWPATESPDKYRHKGSLVVGKGYALVDGLELYPVTKSLEPDLAKPLDIAKHQKIHVEMLGAYAKWWQRARQALYDPRAVAVGEADNKPVRLTAMDWRPSNITDKDGKSPSYRSVIYQKDLLGMLEGLQGEKYRQEFPAYSGSWAVDIKRSGRYMITASLLPKEASSIEQKELAKLRGGRAFFNLGSNKVEVRLHKGASAVTVSIDADAGVTDLECWFTGQLALERELGAFFVEIQRVGEKKFDFQPKR